jgi:hypothetical protein
LSNIVLGVSIHYQKPVKSQTPSSYTDHEGHSVLLLTVSPNLARCCYVSRISRSKPSLLEAHAERREISRSKRQKQKQEAKSDTKSQKSQKLMGISGRVDRIMSSKFVLWEMMSMASIKTLPWRSCIALRFVLVVSRSRSSWRMSGCGERRSPCLRPHR